MSTAKKIFILATLAVSFSRIASGQMLFETTSDAFAPDLLPSQRSALIALADRTSEALKSNASVLNQHVDGEKVFTDELARKLGEKKMSGASSEITLSLDQLETIDAGWMKVKVKRGQFSASFADGGERKSINVRFIEKPWADDWQMFASSDPSHRWLVSRSPSPGATDAEAIAAAQRAARESLLPLVAAELKVRSNELTNLREKVTPDWLADRVADSLQLPRNDGILIRDTFVQKFSRPYGDVWQASVLIDASPKIIGQLADSYTSRAEKDFGAKASGFAAMLGMIGVLGLLYAFINAVTKGYFMWRLRAVALLAAIAGLIAIFAIV